MAIKIAHAGRAPLHEEAVAMARLSSPFVVPVYDILQVDEGIAIIMELVSGPSLARWSAPSLQDACRRLAEAARGLADIHAAGLVHGDLKPANVLVSPDGPARVTDFGLARCRRRGAASVVEGTRGYMAAEVLRGVAPTLASDVYAFAVTATEVLDAAGAGPSLPSELRSLLERGMDRDPERRPSVRVMLRELERAAGRQAQRRTAEAVGVLALVACLAGFGHAVDTGGRRGRCGMVTARFVEGALARAPVAHARARVRYRRGASLVAEGAFASGERELLSAHALATMAKATTSADEVAASISAALVDLYAVRTIAPEKATRWRRQLDADLGRIEAPTPGLRLRVLQATVSEALVHGRHDAAEARVDAYEARGDLGRRGRAVATHLRGRIARARGERRRAVELGRREIELLTDASDIARIHYNVAGLLLELGEGEEAFAHYEQALAGSGALPVVEQLGIRSGRAASIAARGDLDAGEAELRAVLEALRAEAGSWSAELLPTLQCLAAVAGHRGDPAGAVPWLNEAVEIARHASTPIGDPFPGLSLMRASVLYDADRRPEALAAFIEARARAGATDTTEQEFDAWISQR